MGAKIFDDFREIFGRRREIEEAIAANAIALGDGVELRFKAIVPAGVVEVHGEVVNFFGELIEMRIGLIDIAGFENASAHILSKLVAQGTAGDADDGEFFGQEAYLLEVEEGRKELALGEIARGTENDDDGGFRDALVPFGNFGKVLGGYLHLDSGHIRLPLRLLAAGFMPQKAGSSGDFSSHP